MYKNFNIETDKDLILLNYYIEQNENVSIIELTVKDVEKILSTNRSKAYRCIKKLEELNIIEVSNKSNSKFKKTTYKYLLKKECSNNGLISNETNESYSEHLKEYVDIYIKVFEKSANDKEVADILNIKDLEKIEIQLFENILNESKKNATKNRHGYAIKSIQNTIKDNIFTLTERTKTQNTSLNINKNTAKNYTDNSEEEDWDLITNLASAYNNE